MLNIERTEILSVMMKKKLKDHVDTEHINIDKSTEGKENITNPEIPEVVESDNSASDGLIRDVSDGSDIQTAVSDNDVLEVKVVEEELAEMQDKYLRLAAEFDNYRKRTLREKIDLSKYAGEHLIMGIIPLMDDFERALKHMESTTDCAALKDGIEIIYGKFHDFLKQNGIKEIESLNSNFNVDLHEAVAKVPVDDPDKKGKVVDVLLKGYYLQDKVLRHSKVAVGE